MKLTALITAGALAVGTFAVAAPAEAQRGYRDGYRGGNNYRPYRGYNRGIYRGYNRRYYGPRRFYGSPRRFYGNRGYYGGRGFYGRPRVTCRIVRGYYGPVRRCFRVY
jgi:hypothetical protein